MLRIQNFNFIHGEISVTTFMYSTEPVYRLFPFCACPQGDWERVYFFLLLHDHMQVHCLDHSSSIFWIKFDFTVDMISHHTNHTYIITFDLEYTFAMCKSWCDIQSRFQSGILIYIWLWKLNIDDLTAVWDDGAYCLFFFECQNGGQEDNGFNLKVPCYLSGPDSECLCVCVCVCVPCKITLRYRSGDHRFSYYYTLPFGLRNPLR